MHFVCLKCKGIMEGTMDLIEKLCDEVETVNGFCYLGDRLNASGSYSKSENQLDKIQGMWRVVAWK